MKPKELQRKNIGRIVIAFSIATYVIAIMQIIDPHAPNENGTLRSKSAIPINFIYDNFGNIGLVIFWILLGSYLMHMGLRYIKEKSST